MPSFLLLILFYLPNAFATDPLKATVCAHILAAAAELPLRAVTSADHAPIFKILAKLEDDSGFDRDRLSAIRLALHHPTNRLFYFEFSEPNQADDFFLTLVSQLEAASVRHRFRRGKNSRTWRSRYQNFILRNRLLHFDRAYRTAQHSDPAAIPELRRFFLPSRSEHFERDYEWHELSLNRLSLFPQPSPRQGRIDTATFFETLRRHLTGKAFPKDVVLRVAIDMVLEDDLGPPSIFVRIQTN